MDYAQAMAYIDGCQRFVGNKAGLKNIEGLLYDLGQPQLGYPVIHVAGTNGKGSVCCYVDTVLRRAGYQTGLYTSPYLQRFNERIRIRGENAADEQIASWATQAKAAVDARLQRGFIHPAMFEVITAMGFLGFAKERIDAAVVEVGLGGRLDSTNVVQPAITAIAAIGLDHTRVLGDTLEQIAFEKAGIIKPGVPVVLYPQGEAVRAVVRKVAREKGAPLIDLANWQIAIHQESLSGVRFDLRGPGGEELLGLHIRMLGRYQAYNAAVAAAILLELQKMGWHITERDIREGLAQAAWPGRFEVVGQAPLTLIDGAHNPQGAQALRQGLAAYLPKGMPVVLCCGALKGKDAAGVMEALSAFAAEAVLTDPPGTDRAKPAQELAPYFADKPVTVERDAHAAVAYAVNRARELGGAAVVAGSLDLAGAARTWLLEK